MRTLRFGEVQAATRQHAAEVAFASSILLSLANERHRTEGEGSILFNARRLRSVLRGVLRGVLGGSSSPTTVTRAAIGIATIAGTVATTMATTMAALTVATLTMATLTMAATTSVAATITIRTTAIGGTATIAAMATMAGSGLVLGAGQGKAHDAEKQRDSQKQSAIHPRILQNQRYLDVRVIQQQAVAVVHSCRRRRHLPADRDFGLPLKRFDLRRVLPAVNELCGLRKFLRMHRLGQ